MNQPNHQNHVEKSTQIEASLPDRPVSDLQPTSMDDFDMLGQVGEGTYGRVFKARHKKTGRLCALKLVFPVEEEDGLSFTAIREIKYLQQLAKNSNVITLLGTFFTAVGELVLVFEYMENDLSGLLSLSGVDFSPAQIKCLMKQILEGLHQCHAAGIMHRDIKAANLLFNGGVLKLADFGLATNYTSRPVFSTNVVTLWYRAPELLLEVTKYKAKVDIWSAGCIFIELLTRKSPFPGSNEQHQMELIFKMCGTPTEETWPGVTQLKGYPRVRGMPVYRNRLREVFSKLDPLALDLICKMLALDPESRLTASQALDHDYFWTNPMPCAPSELPAYPPMHEFEAKLTRQNEQKQAKRQRGESYVPTTEPYSDYSSSNKYPGVRRPQVTVPMPTQRPQVPTRPAAVGSLPGSAVVDRSLGQQYPPSVVPQPQPQSQQQQRRRDGGAYRMTAKPGPRPRMGERGPVHSDISRVGTQGGRTFGIYDARQHQTTTGGGLPVHSEKRPVGRSQGEVGDKDAMDTMEDSCEAEEGEILVYNRPPSDHSLDVQPQPPTGIFTSAEHGRCGSPSAFSTAVSTNIVMVGAAGKRKRGEV